MDYYFFTSEKQATIKRLWVDKGYKGSLILTNVWLPEEALGSTVTSNKKIGLGLVLSSQG